MSKKSTSTPSHTDWKRVKRMRDDDLDLSDIPEVNKNQVSKPKLRVNGKPVSKGKVRVNILLDASVVAYFKEQAGGRGYQTLINQTLKDTIHHRDLESMLRRIIREELQGGA